VKKFVTGCTIVSGGRDQVAKLQYEWDHW